MVEAKKEMASKNKPKFITILFAIISAIFLLVLSIMIFFVVITYFIAFWLFMQTKSWHILTGFEQICACVAFWLLLLLMVLFGIIMFWSALEVCADRDKNHIMSVFSGIVSFVALIIAIVALFDDSNSEVIQILNEIKGLLDA